MAGAPVRALEIKLSQGAKPSLGELLPAPKVSAEIAAARGVPEGRDCVSPSRHAEFSDTDSLLDWVELLAAETGLPVGIKSAVATTRRQRCATSTLASDLVGQRGATGTATSLRRRNGRVQGGS